MSSTVRSLWEKGEIKKIKNWYNIIPKNQSQEIIVPIFPYEGFIPYREDTPRGICIEFSRNVMTLDTAIWDDVGQAYSILIVQELSKIYKLKNAGWDSVGFCLKDFLKSNGLYIYPKWETDKKLIKEVDWMKRINEVLRVEAKTLTKI